MNPSKLDKDEKGAMNHHALSGNQQVSIINESGLCPLILRTLKPEAKAFKKWVIGTALPAIRKNGGYIMGEDEVANWDGN
ncbi:BRO-N domain-containing protein [Nitratidesulfovibrio sp. D1]|uniref:BRO-N domain-containing protein n=1 Tax=Nitratidesulfovibrio sp. D1 TaxID=3440151 RepID=UPI003EBCD856